MRRRYFVALVHACALLLAPGDSRVATRASGALPPSLSDRDFRDQLGFAFHHLDDAQRQLLADGDSPGDADQIGILELDMGRFDGEG